MLLPVVGFGFLPIHDKSLSSKKKIFDIKAQWKVSVVWISYKRKKSYYSRE